MNFLCLRDSLLTLYAPAMLQHISGRYVFESVIAQQYSMRSLSETRVFDKIKEIYFFILGDIAVVCVAGELF